MKGHRYARYIKLAKRTGCLKFHEKFRERGKTMEESEVLEYFVETSNWFLFSKNGAMLKIIDLDKG